MWLDHMSFVFCQPQISHCFIILRPSFKCLFIHSEKYFFFFFSGWAGSSLLCADFLELWPVRATLHCAAQASHCSGFSCRRAQSLGMWASVVAAHGLETAGSVSWYMGLVAPGMWNLPGPEIKPMSPLLAGRFLSTAPPGKSK